MNEIENRETIEKNQKTKSYKLLYDHFKSCEEGWLFLIELESFSKRRRQDWCFKLSLCDHVGGGSADSVSLIVFFWWC